MKTADSVLAQLGWKRFFDSQVLDEERQTSQPVRVMSVHRGRVTVTGEGFEGSISSSFSAQDGGEDRPTVGDWLLIDRSTRTPGAHSRSDKLVQEADPW